MFSYEFLQVEKIDHIFTIKINRPERLNALNEKLFLELESSFCHIEKESDIRAVLITGAGKAFVAGADISAMQNMSVKKAEHFSAFANKIFLQIERCSKPVIAAVNGYCLGGGNELAMACDIRYASTNAMFGQPEVNLGVIPCFGGTFRLAKFVGVGKAKEMMLTGDFISAQDAMQWGLVQNVFPENELWERSLEAAKKIASKGPQSIRILKKLLDDNWNMEHGNAGSIESMAFGLCFSDSQAAEGMTAFLEKRPPRWEV